MVGMSFSKRLPEGNWQLGNWQLYRLFTQALSGGVGTSLYYDVVIVHESYKQ